MKEGWENKSIGDVCTVIAGQSPESKYYNIEETGLPFYQGKKEFTEKYLGEPTTWTSKTTKEAQKDDILMSVRAPVGPVNFATQRICIGRGLAAIRTSDKINKNYLFYFLQKHESEIEGNTGAVFNSINKSQIGKIKIPIPPLSEQKKIVAILDEAFAAIDEAKANIEKNIENAGELFQSRLNEIFSQKGEGWEEKKLSELCEVKDGTHDSPRYVSEQNGIPFVTQKNISEAGLSFEKIKFISEKDHDDFYRRSNVAYNDILLSMIGANRGMACIVNDERTFSIKNVGLIKANDNYRPNYLLYFLKSSIAKEYVKNNSRGSAQGFIGLGALRGFPVPYIRIEKQKIIENQIREVDLELKSLKQCYFSKLDSLKQLKKSLLQKAFAGELT